MNATPPSSLPPNRAARAAGRAAPWTPRAAAVGAAVIGLATLALTGCDRVTPAVLGGGYPSLATVPPRPVPAYTVPQREAVTRGLLYDRESARYSDRVVRYRAGLTGEPPPPAPPPPPPPVAPPAPPAAAAEAAPAWPADSAFSLPPPPTTDDDGSLNDFIRGLVRETESRAAPEEQPPSPAPPVAPAGEATGEPEPTAGPSPVGGGTPAIGSPGG